jgi:hypothetical protein
MEVSIYTLWQLTAVLIFLLSFTMFYVYLRRYRESLSNLNLFLALFFFILGLRYLFAFLLRVFAPIGSPPVWYGTLLYSIAVACNGILPLPAIFFALETFRPGSDRRHGMIPTVISTAYLLTLVLYPPHIVETTPGIYEYVLSPISRYFAYAAFSMSFLPAVIFSAFAMRDKTKRRKSVMYAVGFFTIAYFAEFADPFGLPPVIYIRRAMIVFGLLVIFFAQRGLNRTPYQSL